MRHIALASIRSAAATIRNSGGNVTIGMLARLIDCEKSNVRRYLYGIDGLREEVGYMPDSFKIAPTYLKLIELMVSRDIHITNERLAAVAGSTRGAVAMWRKRHSDEVSHVKFISGTSLRKRHLLTRIRRLCTIRGKLSIGQLAAITGRERTALYRLLRDNPQVFEGL